MTNIFRSTTLQSRLEWVLRLGVFGEFLGHGVLALQGKAAWVGWMVKLFDVTPEVGLQLVQAVGVLDVIVAVFVLILPLRFILLWAAFWGLATAVVRPVVGEPIWDFVERWANWAAPLALLLLRGWPKQAREWFR